MKNWDYAWRGYYFITICTQGRENYFGEVINGRMILSELGEIAKSKWLKSPEIRPDMNLELDEFQIMPDHIHGIIRIGRNEYNKFDNDIIKKLSQKGKNKFGPQRKNIASIIRGFKSAVTINARKINHEFSWQSRFYSLSRYSGNHVIKDEQSLNNIRRYIKNNPKNWKGDG